MRQFTEDTLTDAVVARLKKADDPRFRQIMASAVKHLHAMIWTSSSSPRSARSATTSARNSSCSPTSSGFR